MLSRVDLAAARGADKGDERSRFNGEIDPPDCLHCDFPGDICFFKSSGFYKRHGVFLVR